jgi:glutaredoxin
VRELDYHQRKGLIETLTQQSDERRVIEVIESYFDRKKACPHCNGVELYRYGVISGLQRYCCQHCKKTFNALTGTPLARLRNKGKWVDFVIGLGALSKSQLTDALKPVINDDVLLVSDAYPTYQAFCHTEGISHEVVNLSKGQHVNGAFHVQNVNAYHSRLKAWLQRFHGVATRYLANYLGWRRILEKCSQPTSETLLKAALERFQYLTVT